MNDLFLALMLVSITALIIGLMKPRLILRWDSEKLSKFGYRKAAGLALSFLALLFFVLFGITAEPRKPLEQTPTVKQSQIEQEQQSIEKPVIKPQATQPPAPVQGVLFDIPTLFGKSFSQLKVAIGSPNRQGAADEYTTGWAEWDKAGLTLSINYDTAGRLVDAKGLGCAMSIFPKVGYWEETKLRQVGNLTGSVYPFVVKPVKNINGVFYALEICHQ